MPRRYEVNKKLKVLKYICKMYNLDTGTVYTDTCYSKYQLLQEPIKYCRGKLETDTRKVVEVLQTEHETLYYGMTLDDFMKYGVKLEPDEVVPSIQHIAKS